MNKGLILNSSIALRTPNHRAGSQLRIPKSAIELLHYSNTLAPARRDLGLALQKSRYAGKDQVFEVENATASAFLVATRPELVDRSCRSEAEIPLQRGCGVSERTTIKWNHFLTFRIPLQRDCSQLQGASIKFPANLRAALHLANSPIRIWWFGQIWPFHKTTLKHDHRANFLKQFDL